MLVMTGSQTRSRRGRLVDWSAIWTGLAWTLAITVTFSALWLAIGFANPGDVTTFTRDIEWWLAGTVVVALFVGAFIAGWVPGIRGWGPGLIDGVTVWALLLSISLIVGVPTVLGGSAIVGLGGAGAGPSPNVPGFNSFGSLWATFWVALLGLLSAAAGGALGGATARSPEIFETFESHEPLPRHEHRGTEIIIH